MVAEKMGFDYYDRDIIEMAAVNMGEPIYMLSEYDNHKMTTYSKMMHPLGFGAVLKQNKLFDIERNIVLDLARKKDCVIVGRCADYILTEAGHESLYNVFIYASYAARYNYCLKNLGFTEDYVEKHIERIDKARSEYYQKYTGEKFESLKYRNLLIDSASMEMRQIVETIRRCARIKFGIDAE
jgi:cytidylate kinase